MSFSYISVEQTYVSVETGELLLEKSEELVHWFVKFPTCKIHQIVLTIADVFTFHIPVLLLVLFILWRTFLRFPATFSQPSHHNSSHFLQILLVRFKQPSNEVFLKFALSRANSHLLEDRHNGLGSKGRFGDLQDLMQKNHPFQQYRFASVGVINRFLPDFPQQFISNSAAPFLNHPQNIKQLESLVLLVEADPAVEVFHLGKHFHSDFHNDYFMNYIPIY